MIDFKKFTNKLIWNFKKIRYRNQFEARSQSVQIYIWSIFISHFLILSKEVFKNEVLFFNSKHFWSIMLIVLPSYYLFLKKKSIEQTTAFVYFSTILVYPTFIILKIPHTSSVVQPEIMLVPVVSLAYAFFYGKIRLWAVFINMAVFWICKGYRYYFYKVTIVDVVTETFLFAIMYAVMINVSYLYVRDYFSLTVKKKKLLQFKRELTTRRNELEELNETKNTLFRIISHDLKSPIMSLQELLNMFEREKLDIYQFKDLVHRLKTNLGSIYHMLDDLLIWSLSQMKGEGKRTPINVNIKEAIEDAKSVYTELLSRKNILFLVEVPESKTFWVDRNEIVIVLRNIINNAIKFLPDTDGKILVKTIDENEMVILQIIDNGRGISQEKLKNIFTKPMTNNQLLNITGTGVGLVLCKELLKVNQGQITIDSIEGVSTTVSLLLPAHADAKLSLQEV